MSATGSNAGSANSQGENEENERSEQQSQAPPTQDQQAPPTQGQNPVIAHMLSNKVDAALWLTRVFTVICTILFLLPIFGGNPHSFYQRSLISSAATSALRLHQRLPNFQFSREFFGRLFLEDSCHYLFYSMIFLGGYPVTMGLVPVFLFAILHATAYTKALLNLMGPGSLQFMHTLIQKLESHQTNILRFVACTEILLMPAILFMMCSGRASLLLPFLYYRFLSLRYASRRNPYSRTVFGEMRMTIEHLCTRPQCPGFLGNACSKVIALISRLAPQVDPTQS